MRGIDHSYALLAVGLWLISLSAACLVMGDVAVERRFVDPYKTPAEEGIHRGFGSNR